VYVAFGLLAFWLTGVLVVMRMMSQTPGGMGRVSPLVTMASWIGVTTFYPEWRRHNPKGGPRYVPSPEAQEEAVMRVHERYHRKDRNW
jgi:hypothetical protein